MAEPFIGEIRMISFNFAPKGWAFCNGQILPAGQNRALFEILGKTYGGDGQTTFGLPNLQGRTPFHVGPGFSLGQSGGEEAHALTIPEIPAHTHAATASSAAADQVSPANGLWANSGINTYSSYTPNTTMSSLAIDETGEGQPHPNLSPYLVLNFVIALEGIFPPKS
jgi:microcystin-dependent protein